MTNRKPIAVCGILLLAGGIVLAQQAPQAFQPSSGPPGFPPSAVTGQTTNLLPSVGPGVNSQGNTITPIPSPVAPEYATVRIPRKPDEMSIDQLLDAIEQVRSQKAELEKREAELVKAAKAKVTAQKSRLEKLGVIEAAQEEIKGGERAIPPTDLPRR